jgi:hypothetical protein
MAVDIILIIVKEMMIAVGKALIEVSANLR